jgi:hypothetical protein
MSLRDTLLKPLDVVRSIPGLLGQRRYMVKVRVTRWSGGDRIGKGARVITDTDVLGYGNQSPRVRELSSKEVIAQGGTFEDQLFEIGPINPQYVGGGVAAVSLDPALHAIDPQEVHYLLAGPELPPSGVLCSVVRFETQRNYQYKVVVKRIGVNK